MRELTFTVSNVDAYGELRVTFGPERFTDVKNLIEFSKKEYEEGMTRSIRTSLDSEEIVNPILKTDNERKTAIFTFEWKNCVKKTDSMFDLQVSKSDTTIKVHEGIGFIDILKIVLPTGMVPTLTYPDTAKVSKNIIIWYNFNWNVGLKVKFKKSN